MNLKKFCSGILFSIVIVLAATSSPSWAADYTKVGVRVGDFADYTVQISDSNATRMHLYVYGIVETTVYLNITTFDETGNLQSSYTIMGDIRDGFTFLFYRYLITPHLQKDDPIYSGASIIIAETLTMEVAGASRSVNQYRTADSLIECWWDQATGIIVKLNLWFFGWINITSMISTSLWSGGLSETIILVIVGVSIFIIGVILGYFIGRGRGEKPQKKRRK